MHITIMHTLQPEERAAYEKLLKRIFPTKPLYIFISVSTLLLALMGVQHFANPATYSLVFISISLLCILFGGTILYSTKKSLPDAKGQLESALGKSRRYTFTDTQVTLEQEGCEPAIYMRDKLIGQYCTDRYYVFCFGNRTLLVPMIIGITPENISDLNTLVQSNNARGIKLKKFKAR